MDHLSDVCKCVIITAISNKVHTLFLLNCTPAFIATTVLLCCAVRLTFAPTNADLFVVPCPFDTACDFQTGTPKTQLIAHDKEVYDIAFAR